MAVVTIGQTPRPDMIPELMGLIDEPVEADLFGILDDFTPDEIINQRVEPDAPHLSTRLRDGQYAVVSVEFVDQHLRSLLLRLDGRGYDLLAVVSTGVPGSYPLNTACVQGHHVVENWVEALVSGNGRVGMVYPLHKQAAERRGMVVCGTLVENAQGAICAGHAGSLDSTVAGLQGADLVLMHSVAYNEEAAQRLSATMRKPVVTARRLIAGAIRARLQEINTNFMRGEKGVTLLIDLLPTPETPLTPREREVLSLVLQGNSNKHAARQLNISHRTVEIHRGRALAKFGSRSAAELIQCALHNARIAGANPNRIQGLAQ